MHGLIDIGAGDQWYQPGFSESIQYFLSHGYKKSELYVTTWGYADPAIENYESFS